MNERPPTRVAASGAEVRHVADRVHSAAIHLLRALRREDEAAGLTASRLSALSVIVFGGPVTVSGLAEAEQVSVPTISRMLRAMEEEGLVVRRRDESDRRVVWIEATPRGSDILREGRRRRVEALAAALEMLGPDEVAVLARAAELLERTSDLVRGEDVSRPR